MLSLLTLFRNSAIVLLDFLLGINNIAYYCLFRRESWLDLQPVKNYLGRKEIDINQAIKLLKTFDSKGEKRIFLDFNPKKSKNPLFPP